MTHARGDLWDAGPFVAHVVRADAAWALVRFSGVVRGLRWLPVPLLTRRAAHWQRLCALPPWSDSDD